MQKIFSILLCFLYCGSLYAKQIRTVIEGEVNNFECDSITLYVYPDHYVTEALEGHIPSKMYVCRLVNGKFKMELNTITNTSFFSIILTGVWNCRDLLVDPGDSLHLIVESGNVEASGRGSIKIEAWNVIQKERDRLVLANMDMLRGVSRLDFFTRSYRFAATYTKELSKILSGYKRKLTKRAYEMYLADIIGQSYSDLNKVAAMFIDAKGRDRILPQQYDTLLACIAETQPDIGDSVFWDNAAYSFTFTDYARSRISIYNMLTKKEKLFAYIKQVKYSGLLQEKVLTSFFMRGFATATDRDSLYQYVCERVANPIYRKAITKLYNARKVGTLMHDFVLPDRDGNKIALSSYRGKLVFIDFWFTGCGGCAKYYKSVLSKVEEHFKKDTNIVFMTISTDEDKELWVKSIDGKLYTSPGAVNLYTNGEGSKHSVITENSVTAWPTSLLVGRDGRLISSNAYELGYDGDARKLVIFLQQQLLAGFNKRQSP